MSIFNLFRRNRPQQPIAPPVNYMLMRWLQRLELHYAVGQPVRGDFVWVNHNGDIALGVYVDALPVSASGKRALVALISPHYADIQHVGVLLRDIVYTGYSAMHGTRPMYNWDARAWEFWRDPNTDDDEDTREMGAVN